MSEKLPWMPFYGSDFYHDEAVRLMSLEEEAIYIRLLWWQWREGSLPADPEHLAKLCGCICSAVTPHVLACLPVTRDADGRRRNPRLEEVRQQQLALIEAKSRAAKMRWAKEKRKPKQRISTADAAHKRSISNTDTESNKKMAWLTPFADAWQAKCGNPPYGRLAKALAPLRQSLGEPEALARWSRYLDQTEPRYCSPNRFADTHAAYTGPVTQEMTDEYGRMVPHRKNAEGQWVPVVSVA